MAGMKFTADIDIKNIIKLRQEIDKLKKSLIEIASAPNSDAAVKALEKQLSTALKKLEEYKDKYVQTQQARLDQEKAASEQIKKQQKEIDSLIKKYEALQKKIEEGTVRPPRSPKTYTDDQISAALNTQVQSIREAREQLKVLRFAQANVTDQQEKEMGARTKLNIKIQENTRYLKLNSDAYTRQKMEIGNYEENIRRALDGTGQFNLSLSKMLGVIGGTAALKGLVTDMINVRGEFQKTSIAFETMLGSKEKADALMAQMVETAAKTPFDLQGVTSGAKQLLAYGTSADKVNETLVRLGNIASGLSIPLGDLVYLYGTSMSQGRLFTQDVNQFMGRGIPLVAELAKELGKTESEIRKMVTEGKVGFPELQKVIENMTNEGGKFYNLMEMQSTTLSGQISNLGDAWDSMLNSIGEDTQGIASMTISAVTSIIENYDKVGKIILSIAATYGTYKAALIAVELYERRAAAARLLHIKIIRAQAMAQAALNLVSKANPYVLLATAIVGVTTAMWALHDSTTTTEREMERISKRTEVYNKYLQDEKNHVNELISVLQNENSTKKERIEAFNELQTKYPQYFGKYKTEKELIDHLTESLKGYNEQLRIRQELMNVKNNNDDIKRYKELEKFLSLARKGKDQRTSVEESDFNFYLKKYDVSKRGIGVTVEEYIQEMLASLSATIGAGQEIIRKQEQTAWEVALDSMDKTTAEGHKKMLEGYKILLKESGKEWIKIEGSEAPINADILTNRIKQLNDKILNVEWKNAETYRKEAKIAWEKAKKEVEDVKSGKATYKSEADYQKALKEKQDAESDAEKRYKNLGGITGNKLSKQEKEAEKRKKEQKKLNEELLSLRRQNQQAEIDLMEEGTEKTLKQIDLDYQKELDAIKKQEKDLMEKQGGKLTQEQSIEISTRYTNAERKREKGISDTTREQLEAQKDAWNEYYIEYGKYQEKRMAIMEKYDKQIAKAEEGSAEKAALTAQRKKELDDLDKELLDSSELWSKFFTDFSNRSSSSIRSIIEDIQELIDYMNGVEGAQIPDIFKDNEKAVKAINDAMSNPSALKKFTSNLESSIKKFKKMLDEDNPFKQISEGFKTKDSKGISKGFQGIASAAKELTGILEELGVESDSTAGKVTSVLGNTASYAATGASVGGPWGAIIGGAIGMATGLVGVLGADYSAYNKMKDEYASLIDVWDILINKKKEYVNISYGDEARKAGEEAIDLIGKKLQSNIELGIERLNSGASAGSHSIGVRIRKSMSNEGWRQWDEFAQSIGIDPDSIGGRLTGLFGLTAEQLSKLQEDAPTFWAKLDDDVKGYLQDIIDCNEEIENMKEQLKETMTGVSFDSFYDNFVSTLSDMDKDSQDFADDFENYLKNAILSNLVANKYRSKIEALYNDWANKSDSNGDGIFDLTSSEADELRKAQQALAEEMIAERDAMAEVFGWTSSASSQESSKKGFATMSQDSADELNGRFTALQIAGEEIKNQNQLQTMSILDLKAGMLSIGANTSGIKDIASETRDLIRLSYEAITDIRDNTNVIVKPIQQMAADIAEVKRNTNGLSKK
jgi:tape measure domain-containing protein